MGQLAFHGDGVELLGDFIGSADDGDTILSLHFVRNHRWGDKDTNTGLPEGMH